MTLVEKIKADHLNEWYGFEDPKGKKNENSSMFWGWILGEMRLTGENRLALMSDFSASHVNTQLGRRRSPNDERTNSHDNWDGSACAFIHLKMKTEAEEMLKQVRFGFLWITGPAKLNSEWIVRPEGKAMMRIAARKLPSPLGRIALFCSLVWVDKWNMKRMRILALKHSGYHCWLVDRGVRIAERKMGDKYKGYFAPDSIFHEIFEAQRNGSPVTQATKE